MPRGSHTLPDWRGYNQGVRGIAPPDWRAAKEREGGEEPWDEAWRVKEATKTHLLRYIPRWCGPGGPYARPRVLAVEVEAAGLISWSPGCSGNIRGVSAHLNFQPVQGIYK